MRIAGRRGAPPGSNRCQQLAPRSAGSAEQDGAGLPLPLEDVGFPFLAGIGAELYLRFIIISF